MSIRAATSCLRLQGDLLILLCCYICCPSSAAFFVHNGAALRCFSATVLIGSWDQARDIIRQQLWQVRSIKLNHANRPGSADVPKLLCYYKCGLGAELTEARENETMDFHCWKPHLNQLCCTNIDFHYREKAQWQEFNEEKSAWNSKNIKRYLFLLNHFAALCLSLRLFRRNNNHLAAQSLFK